MRRVLKWVGIILGILIVLLILAWAWIYFASQAALNQVFQAPPVAIVVSGDAAQIERGKHLATSVSVCIDCHGEYLGGTVFLDDPALGRSIAPNLTSGRNGLGSQLSDTDMARALRYGVRPDGRSVLGMPSQDYTYLSDADLAAIIAYVRSMPPVDSNLPPSVLRPVGRVLVAFKLFPILIAQRIDFNQQPTTNVQPGASAEYGAYLVKIAGCTGCHGLGLSGGPIPAAPPDWPPAANLTSSGEMKTWSEADFITLLRTGSKPGRKPLHPVMPIKYYANMTDDELKAIWLYIQSVPARPYGTH